MRVPTNLFKEGPFNRSSEGLLPFANCLGVWTPAESVLDGSPSQPAASQFEGELPCSTKGPRGIHIYKWPQCPSSCAKQCVFAFEQHQHHAQPLPSPPPPSSPPPSTKSFPSCNHHGCMRIKLPRKRCLPDRTNFPKKRCPPDLPLGGLQLSRLRCSLTGRVPKNPCLHIGSPRLLTFQGFRIILEEFVFSNVF